MFLSLSLGTSLGFDRFYFRKGQKINPVGFAGSAVLGSVIVALSRRHGKECGSVPLKLFTQTGFVTRPVLCSPPLRLGLPSAGMFCPRWSCYSALASNVPFLERPFLTSQTKALATPTSSSLVCHLTSDHVESSQCLIRRADTLYVSSGLPRRPVLLRTAG